MSWLWLPALLAALAALPFLAEVLRRPIDPLRAPGDLAEGAEGVTHFRWHEPEVEAGAGPGKRPVAVCIHGLTTPCFVFDGLAGHLVKAGYRVLSYDLPGRGYTPPRPGPQDEAFFVAQLRALLVAEGIETVDVLIGYSMGGAIATAFTAAEPGRVKRLVLLAPAGLFHDPGPLAKAMRRVLGLGDWAMLVLGGAMLRRGMGPGGDAFARAQRAETRKRGYLPAVLSSLRHILAGHQGRAHKKIAGAGVPVLAIWGEEDDTIPVSNIGRLAELNRKAQQVTVPGADHAMPYTHHAELAEPIRSFLTETAR
jgi:pimeloyl-ACP methyl ester carboxylesterase